MGRTRSEADTTAPQTSDLFIGRTLAEVERELILDTLDHCLGNRTRAARILGVSLRTLRNKLAAYAVEGVAAAPPGGHARRASV